MSSHLLTSISFISIIYSPKISRHESKLLCQVSAKLEGNRALGSHSQIEFQCYFTDTAHYCKLLRILLAGHLCCWQLYILCMYKSCL